MSNNSEVKFLYLDEQNMLDAGVLDMKQCVKVIEETFKLLGAGDYLMGGPTCNEHGQMLWFPKNSIFNNMPLAGPDRRFMAMIAYLGGRFNVCGEKWYGSNIANPSQRGLPRSILMVVLNDPETGAPLAIMSGNLISAMRTGAVPGVAAKYLARKGADTVSILGAGVISRACLLAICENLPDMREVRIFDVNEEQTKRFISEMSQNINANFVSCVSPEESIRQADIISVATSGAKPVEIRQDWLREEALVALTGVADIKPEMYLNSTLVADNWKMHKAWISEGEEHPDGVESILSWAPSAPVLRLILDKKIKHEDISSLGDIIHNRVHINHQDKRPTIFLTGGMPVEDLAWGYTIYKNALEKGIGQELKLWDTPHWH
jgi:ornithine cyclodeaminase